MNINLAKDEARYLLRLVAEDRLRTEGMTVVGARKRAKRCHAGTLDELEEMWDSISAALRAVAPEGA